MRAAPTRRAEARVPEGRERAGSERKSGAGRRGRAGRKGRRAAEDPRAQRAGPTTGARCARSKPPRAPKARSPEPRHEERRHTEGTGKPEWRRDEAATGDGASEGERRNGGRSGSAHGRGRPPKGCERSERGRPRTMRARPQPPERKPPVPPVTAPGGSASGRFFFAWRRPSVAREPGSFCWHREVGRVVLGWLPSWGVACCAPTVTARGGCASGQFFFAVRGRESGPG